MSPPRVLAASAFLLAAAAFTTVTSAQTTFSPQYTAFSEMPNFTEPPPYPVFQADLNRDGIPDFVADHGQVLLSAGGGKYVMHHFSSGPLAGGDVPLASGDFNGDGKNDVFFYAYTGGNQLFVVAYGDGAGNFPTTRAIPDPPGFVTGNFNNDVVAQATDVNGDGRPDLILADITGTDPQNNVTVNVRLYLNNGNGFTDKGNIYTYAFPAGSQAGVPWDATPALDLLLGDYDSDGHADVALRYLYQQQSGTLPEDSNLIVLYGDGAGHFTAKAVYTHQPTELVFSAADMNEDGRTDLVGANVDQTIHLFLSAAGRTFSQSSIAAHAMAQTYYNYPPLLADFDGNGRKDIGFVGASSDYTQYGFNALYQTTANKWTPGSFTPVDTFSDYFGMLPFIAGYVGNYNHDQKADVSFFTDDSAAQKHQNSADVLLNTGAKSIGSCAAPAIGIHVCSPGAASGSPVRFSFSATSFYPIRKMEVWVDGKKKSETYHTIGTQAFSDVSLSIPAGTHKVSFFSGAYDGTVVKKSITLKVP